MEQYFWAEGFWEAQTFPLSAGRSHVSAGSNDVINQLQTLGCPYFHLWFLWVVFNEWGCTSFSAPHVQGGHTHGLRPL